ncbi:hypothetical protein [Pseudorhodoferax sp.]|uniref:hypothetical protein n=1 Tax=Pseudorhodoferax sp. TaxID=1993553 RepID=UPI002DD6AAE6|nr:hypothetical protein [Pseudorhodoferax sp.]
MKITPKRYRSDSAKAAVQAAQNVAQGPITPPGCVSLRPQDGAFWNAIVTARPRDTWTAADLVVAANLARTQADIEAVQAQIDGTGLLVDGKPNPACDLLDKMTRRALAMARQLMVATIATVGRAQDIGKGAELERRAAADHDDLIPTLATLQ